MLPRQRGMECCLARGAWGKRVARRLARHVHDGQGYHHQHCLLQLLRQSELASADEQASHRLNVSPGSVPHVGLPAHLHDRRFATAVGARHERHVRPEPGSCPGGLPSLSYACRRCCCRRDLSEAVTAPVRAPPATGKDAWLAAAKAAVAAAVAQTKHVWPFAADPPAHAARCGRLQRCAGCPSDSSAALQAPRSLAHRLCLRPGQLPPAQWRAPAPPAARPCCCLPGRACCCGLRNHRMHTMHHASGCALRRTCFRLRL
eukprot:354316-Chlamydomonas_euryale.AAC.8